MKKYFKLVLLVAFLIGGNVHSWGQASTQGKEFYVALTLCAAPSTGLPAPFIAVSTKKDNTKITITNPNNPNWAGVTQTANANQWVVFELDDTLLDQWYPTTANSINNAAELDGATNNYGLKVETSEEVSVYAALRMTNSFDAANILPATILTSEYYTQDYPPYIKPSDGKALSMFTVLATKNNTKVTITPACKTYKGKQKDVPFTITLNAGQTYYVISETLESLSGSHVVSDDPAKPIAVFQGDLFTQIPGGQSARDCTFEQAMPTDYWGTQFVIARSKEKDGNRVRVTSLNDGTSIEIDGKEVAILDEGETFEFEMSKNDWTSSVKNSTVHPAKTVVTEDAVFLSASCPVAVYSYDLSNGCKANTTEMVESKGDPSMVWISPLEQRISEITFGVCGTDKTDQHFINIVCPTKSIGKMTITPDPAEPFSWTPVPGKPEWSYTRTHLSTAGKKQNNESANIKRVFTIKNEDGVIAYVYGNGNDESYAYSVGSAAVKRGVSINGKEFVDDDSHHTTENMGTFCLDTTLTFKPASLVNNVVRVVWDFGDGVTQDISRIGTGDTIKAQHTYTSPGWYDVEAIMYGEEFCKQPAFVDTVNFALRIARPIPIFHIDTTCVEPDTQVEDVEIITEEWGCDSIVTTQLFNLRKSYKDSTVVAQDAVEIHGVWYTNSTQGVTWREKNRAGCDSITTCDIRIVKCLNLEITNDSAAQFACYGHGYDLPFSIDQDGSYGDVYFALEGKPAVLLDRTAVQIEKTKNNRSYGTIQIPTETLQPGRYKATVEVEDNNCGGKAVSPVLDIAVRYPDDVFNFKFNNVLAVYKTNHGGNEGWEFREYQWYLNGEKIENAIESVYHTEEIFKPGDVYFVELTDAKGMKLRSCEFTVPEDIDHYEQEESEPAAVKTFVNRRLYIQKGNVLYDMYGQRVK